MPRKKSDSDYKNSELRISEVKKLAKEQIAKSGRVKKYDLLRKTPEDWGEPPKGEQKSICQTCGCEFEQAYVSEKNSYTSFKNCKKCSNKNRYKGEKAIQQTEGKKSVSNVVSTYTPYPFQQEMHDALETHRILILCAGNRLGKDFFSVMAGIKYTGECLSENRHLHNPNMIPAYRWWLIAPTEDMARDTVWGILKANFPKEWIKRISDSTMTIETYCGGLIECKTAFDPDKLVGVALDLVTVTEAARIKKWDIVYSNLLARLTSAGRGRDKDRNGASYGMGKMIVNSSPIGKGEFYKMWCWGQKNHPDYSSDIISFQFPWTANPTNAEFAQVVHHTRYGDRTNEEILISQMGLKLYQQNYLGMFISQDGAVFENFSEKCKVELHGGELNLKGLEKRQYKKEWQTVIPYRKYRAGWDVATGSSGDTPTLVIRDMVSNKIVRVINLYGKDYDAQYDTVAQWCKYYNNCECVYSLTGHTAVKGNLAKRGVWEVPVIEQGENKRKFVQALAHAVQNGDVHILVDGTEDVDTFVRQMEDYTERNGSFSNNQEPHDDWVSALYFCYYDYTSEDVKIPFLGLMDCI